MLIVGLVLLVLCAVLGTGIALSNTDTVSAEAFGVSLSNVTLGGLFLVGVAVGVVAALGLGLVLAGAARKRAKRAALRRQVQQARVEQETLAEQNARLQAELERQRAAAVPPYADDAAPAAPTHPTEVTSDAVAQGRHGKS